MTIEDWTEGFWTDAGSAARKIFTHRHADPEVLTGFVKISTILSQNVIMAMTDSFLIQFSTKKILQQQLLQFRVMFRVKKPITRKSEEERWRRRES